MGGGGRHGEDVIDSCLSIGASGEGRGGERELSYMV